MQIGRHRIGPEHPTFIIAEAGVNHNGSLDMARQLVEAAYAAGADAVKFQTFKAESLVSAAAKQAAYQTRNTGVDESQLAMLKRLELSFSDFRELASYCQTRGILFLSTPFDHESADFLHELGQPAVKIPSGEITNLPFIKYLARKSRPVILSTGMSNLGEVEAAVRTVQEAGNEQLALLHCVSNYPAEPADVNLRAMACMAHAFGVPVGYSDHTLGMEVALASVALGACIVEKHFTLDVDLPGPDHRASLPPGDLAHLVTGIRRVEACLGDGRKRPSASEHDTALVARRSLVAAQRIPQGATLTAELVAILRPGTGLPPAMLDLVLGRQARHEIAEGTLLDIHMLA